ncbi:hypothetical protein F5B22DRAFT_644628 [Xylaria bambusicola]|uniref:uncharacterized protein n=1 Tax=Xylaria bambusicola TaxID=326684 RepID=UPI00200820A7|nr:uncharacterized protein F5B22DRAFT_644628 [Xylaria bambusicola]KAI0520887.1 hypothetical protein F5B22DRAFT_644628 [Xylaria bambusicola]
MATSVQSIGIDAMAVGYQTGSDVIFEQFDLPPSNQRQLGVPHPTGTTIPLALRPCQSQTEDINLDDVITTIKGLQSHNKLLTKKLALHGTLLFRGLPIRNADDFSRFAHAFGFKPHEIIGIVVDRPVLAPNIAPANKAPKEVLIHSHNESPQVPHAPEYIFLYGHKAPLKGGETPMSSSLELFQRVQDEIPEFIAELTEKGILSRITYKKEPQFSGGSTLKEAFGKTIVDGDDLASRRSKIEAQIARYGRGIHTTWEWLDNDEGIIVTHRLPVIRTQPGTNLPTMFTGFASLYTRKNVTEQLYGDGTPIPEKYLKRLVAITEEIRVLHRWEQGDVLIYDNIIAQHGRQPWEGEENDRVVMASLFDGDEVPGAYGDADWATVVQALEG